MTRLANGTGKIWGLPVLWLWRRNPDTPQVTVVYVFVDASGRTVTGTAGPGAVAGRTVRALPAADGDPKTWTSSPEN